MQYFVRGISIYYHAILYDIIISRWRIIVRDRGLVGSLVNKLNLNLNFEFDILTFLELDYRDALLEVVIPYCNRNQ